MQKSYRNRIKRINKDVSDYLDKGKQEPGAPYTVKRKSLPNDINKLSAPPSALEEELQDENQSEIESIIENWRNFVESEE